MRLALALAGLLLALGCDEPRGVQAPAAPVHPRAAWLLEPPEVALGQVADAVLAVVTPPGVGVQPIPPPAQVPGFAVVGREPQEIVREPSRWVHRTRVRLRAIEVGRFEIPGGSALVEDAEGGVETIAFAALPVEVVSTLPDHPARVTPYGMRTLRGGRGDAATLVAFAAGAVLSLMGVGLVALARRRLYAATPAPAPVPRGVAPPWVGARAALEAARDHAARDPREALDRAARALRRYADERFGGDAHARTTPELAQARPPFALTTRWPAFVALLAALDDARFPRDASETAASRAAPLLEEALAFVDATTPPEARR